MRIGIFGGTFDPIHIGHLACAEEALQQFDLDKVIFMVAGKPALKNIESVAGAQDRYWMCCLATADNPNFEVSTAEIDRVGTTYTIDTLRDLHSQLDDGDELFFILGADALRDVPLWKDARLISEYAHFIVTTRPGYDLAEVRTLLAKRLPELDYTFMDMPALDLSSSLIRERFIHDQGNRYLITEEVEHYVTERELYS
ncbi:MAG: nicotinate-nucleotide adenylyltransferase [Coriobacteriia bacterium]|nr:nicotinate-nucleotide adenylyltransferase [Coriobacteriia bacterium]